MVKLVATLVPQWGDDAWLLVRRRSVGKWEVQIRKAGTRLTKTFTHKMDAQAWARKTESEDRATCLSIPSSEDPFVRDLLLRYAKDVVPDQECINRHLPNLKVLGTLLPISMGNIQ